MYQEYFGFQEPPFSIAPDPHYLYMSERHQEALAHLLYGIRGQGGFILLTGEVGTGKTTVCRCLLEQLPGKTEVAFLFNPKLTATELLATICDEFRIPYPDGTSSIKIFTDKINAYLLQAHASGRKTVLIIDEAQNLSVDVLEQIRLLTNLETNQEKLLQIVMLGQPELLELLKRPDLRQLSQRITARYHLEPLSSTETMDYVRHRLNVAGVSRTLFPRTVGDALFRLSGGVPRLINLICDRALLGTYVQDREKVDRKTLLKAAREVKGEESGLFPPNRAKILGLSLGLLILVAGGVFGVIHSRPDPSGSASSSPSVTSAPGPASPRSGPSLAPPDSTTAFVPLVLPAGTGDSRNEIQAYQTLFRLWGIDYDPLSESPPCQFAHTKGMDCFSGTGSLRDLEHLDRPAILTLYDEEGRRVSATLTSLRASSAVLALGDRIQPVTLQDLMNHWKGEYLLVWRLPEGWTGFLEKGDSGGEVDWLARGLAQTEGVQESAEGPVLFDDRLVERLKRFQLSAGLVPDGIAGPRTLIQLNSRIYSDLPRLSKVAPEEAR